MTRKDPRRTRVPAYPCPWCGEVFAPIVGEYKRAIARGYVPCCSRPCGAEDRKRRRGRKTPDPQSPEGIARKSAYDRARRDALGEALREAKRAAYRANHERHLAQQAARRADPEYREQMRRYQREHNARPEWKAHKRAYDRQYRAELEAGGDPDLAAALCTLWELEEEVRKRLPEEHSDRITARRNAGRYAQARKRKFRSTQ